MYTIRKSIDIDFAHHVHGHSGPCINIHGHTWKFEVTVSANSLDKEGFVMDFKALKQQILEPVHMMLDHGFAIFHETAYRKSDVGPLDAPNQPFLDAMRVLSREMIGTRDLVHGKGTCPYKNRWLLHRELQDSIVGYQADHAEWSKPEVSMNGAYDLDCGGTKIIIFPMPPTSERLAKWLYELATDRLTKAVPGSQVICASIYETLHPVESVASYFG